MVNNSVTWGQFSAVEEVFKRSFGNVGHPVWTTNGAISGVGDNEQIALASGQWAESEMVAIGTDEIEILTGKYVATEGTVIIKYKDGDSEANCDLDTWHTYTGPFTPTGYVRVRLEAP